MSYKKTTWINDSTPVNADNMNKIEEGIEAAHNDISIVQKDLSELSGNTDTSVEALEASVKDLDERVRGVEEDAGEVREKIDLAPMGVISFDDISDPLLAATQALKEAKKFFPDNDVSEYKFVFRERKTGDLYYGTIGNLGTYESAPELLKKVGNPLIDYDEKIESLQQKHEEYDEIIGKLTDNEEGSSNVSNLEKKVEAIETDLEAIKTDLEAPKPAAYVEVENIESASEAQKILEAVNASGLVPEGTSSQEVPAYVYDRNTKFLYKCTSKEVSEIYASLIVGATPTMPEKICYLGDMVSKQYVDDLFQSIVDGNEVAY